MSALLESLAAGVKGNDKRRERLDAIVRGGLPHPRSEAWRQTPLRALERRTFAAPADAVADFDPALLDGIPAPRLVFVNGRFAAAHSDASGLPAGVQFAASPPLLDSADSPIHPDAVFTHLNAALATTGLHLQAAENTTVPVPLYLVTVTAAAAQDCAWHLRHQLNLASGTQVQLLEYHLTDGAHRHLDNTVLELNLAENSRLTHARIQTGSDGDTGFLRTQARLHARADYTRIDVELGGALVRHELDVQLLGDGASLTANGILLAAGRRHLETRLDIEHRARDTRCSLNWRGIGAGRGRGVFHGGITIHPGADGTQAQLSSKNLLLSEYAEIDTQPVLVIHADEVQAAHGATVGQLDANALFYLRTRGIGRDEAQRLLTSAFVREPLLALADNPHHAAIQDWLDHALQDTAAAG